MIGPRKAYFQRKRAEFVATWTTDSQGIVHIPLRDGFEATISESKKELAAQFTWVLHGSKGKYYAESKVPEEHRERLGQCTSLHRVVTGVSKGVEVDHKNGNSLDCTDGNLRWATTSQNTSNRHYKNKTGYRGVVEYKYGFKSQIEFHGKNRSLGCFYTAEQAARRYNQEAIKLFGEFSILNLFDDDYEGDLVDLEFCDPYDEMETMVA